MGNVSEVERIDEDYVIQTGSPHYVRFIESKSNLNIVEFGKRIRYSDQFKEKGINVNSVEVIDDKNLIVNTYERGVEDETLSCGTGVTACVLAFAHKNKITGTNTVKVKVKGGNLEVSFNQISAGIFEDIQLVGPGTFVFSGELYV
jgi:diaminopimelate epimerase